MHICVCEFVLVHKSNCGSALYKFVDLSHAHIYMCVDLFLSEKKT